MVWPRAARSCRFQISRGVWTSSAAVAAHKRAVLTPVVMIIIFRSGLLGGASMDQVLWLLSSRVFNQRPSHVDSNMFVHFLVCLLTSPRVLHTFSSTISMGTKEKTEVGTEVVEGVKKNPTQAKCTVLAIQFFLQNCAQPHEDRTYVLPHINLYLSTRHVRSYHSWPEWNCLFPSILSVKTKNLFPKIDRNCQTKKIAGLRPAHRPYRAVPPLPTQVGTKCLAVVVLDNQDRALCPQIWPYLCGILFTSFPT